MALCSQVVFIEMRDLETPYQVLDHALDLFLGGLAVTFIPGQSYDVRAFISARLGRGDLYLHFVFFTNLVNDNSFTTDDLWMVFWVHKHFKLEITESLKKLKWTPL